MSELEIIALDLRKQNSDYLTANAKHIIEIAKQSIGFQP